MALFRTKWQSVDRYCYNKELFNGYLTPPESSTPFQMNIFRSSSSISTGDPMWIYNRKDGKKYFKPKHSENLLGSFVGLDSVLAMRCVSQWYLTCFTVFNWHAGISYMRSQHLVWRPSLWGGWVGISLPKFATQIHAWYLFYRLLFRHSAGSTIAQKERLASSHNRWQGTTYHTQ